MKLLKNLLKSIALFLFTLLQTNTIEAQSYDRDKAAAYADRYWDTYNSAYLYYTGNNCANFASQCLKAGGLSLNAGPGLDSRGCIPFCDNLHLHLKNHQDVTYKRQHSGYPSWFTKGDIVMFGNSSDPWKHAAVNATSGTPALNANTSNRYHKAVSFFYPGSFSSADFYHINSGSVNHPENDDCSNAIRIVPNGATLTGTVKNATSSYGANQCQGCNCTSPDDWDVYYYFTATASSHTVTVSDYASNFDAVIELRTACGYNTALSCYDPSGAPASTSYTWENLTVGHTYYIRIFEYDNTGTPPNSPTFNIRVSGGPVVGPPSNDDCSNAIEIVPNGATLRGTVEYATSSYGANQCQGCNCTSPDDLDVYYYFTATATSHTVTVSDYASNFDAVIELRTACGYNTAISCYDPSGAPASTSYTWENLTVGHTYYIRIFEYDNTGTPPNSPTFNIRVSGGRVTESNVSEDIYLSQETISSTTVIAGETVDVEVNQNYNGSSKSVTDIYLYYYLSTDCNLSDSDVLLYSGDYSTINATDPTETESETLTIPSEISSGTYYILFVGDATNVVSESNENNGIACIKITVVENKNTAEDITVSNATVMPLTINAGSDFEVEAVQNYSGSQPEAALPDFSLDYYLSTDCAIGTDDKLLGGCYSSLGNDNPTNLESTSLTIPAGTFPGTYYIIFSADNNNKLDEPDEGNNTSCVQINIVNPADNADEPDMSDEINDNSYVQTNIDNPVETEGASLSEKIKIFPNPVNNILNFEIDNSVHIKEVVISNQSGKQVKVIEKLYNNQIDVSDLLAGIYFIKCKSDSNNVAIFKIIKY